MMNKEELKIKLLSFNVFEDNEYLDKYVDLILNNEFTIQEKFKTQRHHIVPRHVYEYLNIGVDNSRDNLVNLIYTDHVMAHFYLVNCSLDDYIKRGNFAALKYIVHNQYTPKEEKEIIIKLPEYKKMYEEYCAIQSKLYTGRFVKEKNGFYGRHHSEKTCEIIRNKIINLPPEVKDYCNRRIREANCGRIKTEEEKQKRKDTMNAHGGFTWWHTDEYRKKLSESLKGKNKHSKGRKHINNEVKQKMVSIEELPIYLANGWVLGRFPVTEETREKYKHRKKGKSTLGYIWVTDGFYSHSIKPEELDKYINLGYHRGRTFRT